MDLEKLLKLKETLNLSDDYECHLKFKDFQIISATCPNHSKNKETINVEAYEISSMFSRLLKLTYNSLFEANLEYLLQDEALYENEEYTYQDMLEYLDQNKELLEDLKADFYNFIIFKQMYLEFNNEPFTKVELIFKIDMRLKNVIKHFDLLENFECKIKHNKKDFYI